MISLLAGVGSAFAEAVVITDAAGIERARVESIEAQKIEFSLSDASGAAADGAEVTLTNSATGEVITTQSVAGVASFEGITPGAWIVSSSTPGVLFTDIQVGGLVVSSASSAGVIGGLSGATLAGGTIAVGGVTAAAIAISDDDNDDDTPLSPST